MNGLSREYDVIRIVETHQRTGVQREYVRVVPRYA
jgi:hypothetical protein